MFVTSDLRVFICKLLFILWEHSEFFKYYYFHRVCVVIVESFGRTIVCCVRLQKTSKYLKKQQIGK